MSALERIDVDALVPDGFEPVEALRCWDFSGGKLFSLTTHVEWTPGQPLEAKCPLGIHTAPHERCTCGIYAATTDAQVPFVAHPISVYGKVKLWGKIIPGERGVRAQYAYPSAFEVPAHLVDDPALKAFGVPITVTDRGPHYTFDPGGTGAAIQTLGLGGSAAAAQYASQSLAQAAKAAQASQNLANLNAPYPLFPARNKPPTHDWLLHTAIVLYAATVVLNLNLLFHLWGP